MFKKREGEATRRRVGGHTSREEKIQWQSLKKWRQDPPAGGPVFDRFRMANRGLEELAQVVNLRS